MTFSLVHDTSGLCSKVDVYFLRIDKIIEKFLNSSKNFYHMVKIPSLSSLSSNHFTWFDLKKKWDIHASVFELFYFDSKPSNYLCHDYSR